MIPHAVVQLIYVTRSLQSVLETAFSARRSRLQATLGVLPCHDHRPYTPFQLDLLCDLFW